MILAFITAITLLANSYSATPIETIKYKSYVAYKQALIEYKKENYEQAAENLEKSLELYANNKKSRDLLIKVREKGAEYFKTGASLIHFNKILAEDYLNRALTLTDPKNVKMVNKINAALESLNSGQE